jgi:hypothetical protein
MLSPETQSMISELDDYKVRKIPFDGITFSQIKDFKGLENDVIILARSVINASSFPNNASLSILYSITSGPSTNVGLPKSHFSSD